MYIPPYFNVEDRETQYALIRAHSFGLLINQVDGAPFATHLPFVVQGDTLVAHMARANPQWQSFDTVAEVLCVFQGPHAYVSPSWYQGDKVVPTWNYSAVHVYGVPRIVADPMEVFELQKRLVDANEQGMPEPWRLEDVDRDYIDSMLRAIVCFEIPITRIEGKAKLSQNKSAQDIVDTVAGLRARENGDDLVLAAAMMDMKPGI